MFFWHRRRKLFLMLRKICSYLILLAPAFLFMGSTPLNKGKAMVEWNEGNELSWTDFKGSPARKSQFSAVTCYSIVFVNKINDSSYVRIYCSFDKKKSWVKKKLECPSLLKHEQGHFDIGEIYTRLFRKKIKELLDAKKTIDYAKLYKSYSEKCFKEQELYDRKTKHSIKADVQKEWNDKIAKDLEGLSAYQEKIIKAN